MSSNKRRKFLATCGVAAGSLATAGCLGTDVFSSPTVVAAVEWKNVRVTDERSNRPYAEVRPTDGPVVNRAPISLGLQTIRYDDDGSSTFEDGSLSVSEGMATTLGSAYERVEYSIVLTLYEPENVADVPTGNSYGYRIDREGFNRVDPGNRVVFRFEKRDDLPYIADVVDVTAGES
ncbi:twin-arginine translocation signal domain-containing protein [Haloprofundus salinisoli]|uniref:twin-arginine translocation signal domain-containing protein n=1 Tax=Haloprofundus salinisoli TaxID=2876193 RepID=UPI001CCE415A|nr:twin-arginine translocation signal domain-containing protein [Haloprofundus salinisoli]